MRLASQKPSAAILAFTVVVASQDVPGSPTVSCSGDVSVKDATDIADAVTMLQVNHRRVDTRPSQPACVARAQNLKPVAWMHVPKCGGDFLNTLIHNPTLCPFTPADTFLPDDDAEKDPYSGPLLHFLPQFPFDAYCPGAWSKTYGVRDHQQAPIASVYADNVGHFVTTLRQPEQRIISTWNHMIRLLDGRTPPVSPKQFAMDNQGLVVKMITTERPFGNQPPTKEQDALAVQRLREGFAFVGLTEEWSLSTCLFHAMFGGTCVREEFHDSHLGTNRTNHDPYDTTMLEGFIDVHDALVYEEGVNMFESNIQHYEVSRSNCPSSCM